MQPLLDALTLANKIIRRVISHWIVFIGTFACVILVAVAVTNLIGPRYTSEMTVTAVSGNQTMLGGLAGAAGLLSSGSISSLATSILNPTSALDNYQDLLQSHVVAAKLMEKYQIEKRLFPNDVDAKTGLWKHNLKWTIKSFVNSILGVDIADRPTVNDVQLKLNDLLVVTQSSQNQNMITVSCTWREPKMCTDLLLLVHKETEARLNTLVLAQAQRTVDYITGNLPKVQIAEVREAMIEVLSTAEKTIAMTAYDQPVAGILLDPPSQSEKPSFPRPSLILEIAAFLALLIATISAWFAETINVSWTSRVAVRANSRTV